MKRDMTGTARCDECKAIATHERGPGSPLSIKHRADCSTMIDNTTLANRLRMIVANPTYMNEATRRGHLLEAADRLARLDVSDDLDGRLL